MGKVLVEASTITCGAGAPHQGAVKMKGTARLVVSGSKALTTASVLGPAKTTPFPGCTNPGDSTNPCTQVTAMTAGASTRLRVDGVFVVLEGLKATTDKQSPIKVKSIKNDRLEAE